MNNKDHLAVADSDPVPAPCTCRADIDKSLTERFASHAPEATEHSVQLQGYGFAIVGNKMISAPFMEYKATAKYPVKKTGGTKEKTVRGNMVFNFCPFCGQNIKAAGAPV